MTTTIPGQASAPFDTLLWVGDILFVIVVLILFFVWLHAVENRRKRK